MQVMPLGYYIYGGVLQFIFLLFSRFGFRLIYLENRKYNTKLAYAGSQENAMLIGAGEAGLAILRDLSTNDKTPIRVCCIIDDNPEKRHCSLEGIPIVGGRNDIIAAVGHYGITKILFAIPSASTETKRDILNICKETGCKLLTLPGMYQIANDEFKLSQMREVKLEDLLGRKPVVVNNDEIFSNIVGHVILVTGGGGSIGSELCRQIAAHSPKHLIVFDIYENNAYDIQQELKRHYPELNLTVLIGSVRDSRRIESVFSEYRPELVFHAAAHKHVPLMEDSPCEAIKNNVLGTYKAALSALMYGCKRFILISTDKAVNPTNVMGASKRICEMIIQTMDSIAQSGNISILPHLDSHNGFKYNNILQNTATPRTEFVAVRFGNVLGSNGSVIPLFKKQISEGGPVTVTDPRIIRYFMTIPEAVSLVLQSATYAKGGEIFVLDMGEPVNIDSMARNLIKLSGLKPDVDIEIKYTGLRPGEKLYEEKLMSEEGLEKTANKLIHIAKPLVIDTEKFLMNLRQLIEYSSRNDSNICQIIKEAVPTYIQHNQ